jgi:hypothetical protein
MAEVDEIQQANVAKLAELRLMRAQKARADRLKQIVAIAKGCSSPAEAATKGAKLGADGIIAVMIHVGLGSAPLEPRACLKALRPLLPLIKEKMKGEAKPSELIDSFASWLIGAEGRVEGVAEAVPKMMVHMYDQALFEEEHSKAWWAEHCKVTEAAEKEAAEATAAHERATVDAAQLAQKATGAAEASKEAVANERATKKQAENSKCGGGATAEEEAWEKQCAQAHRTAIKVKEQNMQRAAATKKSADVGHQEKLSATKEMEGKRGAAGSLTALRAAMEPYIQWLDTAEVGAN